ncbi:UNVERIFIED_CONTAM: hypothetical protein K2H54_026022 [Gekko kuhli]
MDLRILEHRVRVLSIARGGLWLYMHPLLKMLLLPQRSRCKFFSLTETPEDYTVILDEEGFKGMLPLTPSPGVPGHMSPLTSWSAEAELTVPTCRVTAGLAHRGAVISKATLQGFREGSRGGSEAREQYRLLERTQVLNLTGPKPEDFGDL